jgi:hypothetical protein
VPSEQQHKTKRNIFDNSFITSFDRKLRARQGRGRARGLGQVSKAGQTGRVKAGQTGRVKAGQAIRSRQAGQAIRSSRYNLGRSRVKPIQLRQGADTRQGRARGLGLGKARQVSKAGQTKK